MSLFAPITETARGLRVYLRGLQWLKEHPRYMTMLFIPMLLALFFVVGGLSAFASYDEVVFEWILFEKPAEWYWLIFYYISWILLYLAVIVLTLLASMLLMNVIASPIYEVVSVAVERDVTGQTGGDLSIWENVKVMLVELKKVAFILGVSIVLLFVPLINVISTLIAAFMVGWDFFDYPLARRGWSFRRRLRFVGGEFWSVMGFGLWLVIPFVQIIVMPLAVAGGTLLNLEALEKRQLLTATPGEDA